MENRISLAHGEGGQLAANLIQEVFVEVFGHKEEAKFDAAILSLSNTDIAITTDSFVVHPLFFPGGNIGKLSIAGTVNDLAVSGAIPKYITAGFIIEEGFLVKELKEIVRAMAAEAENAKVRIVAGDTKVVEKGKADGLYINTTGIGILNGSKINPKEIKEGDSIIVSGTIGDHGIAILTARKELGIETDIRSDSASLNHMIREVLQFTNHVRIMRDPTRGGLATSLVEICEDFNVNIEIEEKRLPIHDQVQGICDILGYEPIYIANEGKVIIIVDKKEEQQVLSILNRHHEGKNAKVIGKVTRASNEDAIETINNHIMIKNGSLLLKTEIGSIRKVERLPGLLLPRIC